MLLEVLKKGFWNMELLEKGGTEKKKKKKTLFRAAFFLVVKIR
jgi:hypothetical protein